MVQVTYFVFTIKFYHGMDCLYIMFAQFNFIMIYVLYLFCLDIIVQTQQMNNLYHENILKSKTFGMFVNWKYLWT